MFANCFRVSYVADHRIENWKATLEVGRQCTERGVKADGRKYGAYATTSGGSKSQQKLFSPSLHKASCLAPDTSKYPQGRGRGCKALVGVSMASYRGKERIAEDAG